jgi:hypothetical protein
MVSGFSSCPKETRMTSKKVEEVLPEGSVSIETVRQLDGFDPFAEIPEVATWRTYSPDALAEAEKAEKAAARKHHAPAAADKKSEG